MLSATLEEQDQMLANGLREDRRPKIDLVLNLLFRKRRPDISKIPVLNPTLFRMVSVKNIGETLASQMV